MRATLRCADGPAVYIFGTYLIEWGVWEGLASLRCENRRDDGKGTLLPMVVLELQERIALRHGSILPGTYVCFCVFVDLCSIGIRARRRLVQTETSD